MSFDRYLLGDRNWLRIAIEWRGQVTAVTVPDD